MAFKKEAKKRLKAVPFLEEPENSDLPERLQKISEQTGLSSLSLLQKWILQEESLIGLMQRSKTQTAKQSEILHDASPQQSSDVQEREKNTEVSPDSPNYRKMLIGKAEKLKNAGATLVKIAAIFNEEKLPTVSGKGKWYSSSLTVLLNSKIEI
ncbi:MAG: hypothetical protein LBO82_06480 [Synergistaceae bacterium]|jgi:hypothetical protein|nr:hypothetical protein [Synergistaceae bacterium]